MFYESEWKKRPVASTQRFVKTFSTRKRGRPPLRKPTFDLGTPALAGKKEKLVGDKRKARFSSCLLGILYAREIITYKQYKAGEAFAQLGCKVLKFIEAPSLRKISSIDFVVGPQRGNYLYRPTAKVSEAYQKSLKRKWDKINETLTHELGQEQRQWLEGLILYNQLPPALWALGKAPYSAACAQGQQIINKICFGLQILEKDLLKPS